MEIIALQKWISPHKTYYWKQITAHTHISHTTFRILSENSIPYNIYDKKRAKETLHIIYVYSYQESKNSMQNIYSRIYNVQNIPPNKKSLHIPQKSKITICNNIICLEVAFYRINTKQHLNPYSIQSSRCYITNYCIYDKTTISILKSALH